MVADEDQLSTPLHDGNQCAGFRGLSRFVHQYDGKLSGFEQAMAAPDGGGTDDFGFVEDAGRHGVFHSPNFFLVDADVAVHQAFLAALE